MEGVMGARYPPYSNKKLEKLVPAVKPGFDRDGNDASRGTWRKWGVVLGVGLSIGVGVSDQGRAFVLGVLANVL
jgi:hypothetical protein